MDLKEQLKSLSAQDRKELLKQLHTVEGGEFFDLMLDTGALFDGEQTTKLLFIVKVLDKGSRKIL